MARSWKDLQKLQTTIANSLVDVTSAAMLILLVMFIFCLLGMQFFGGKWTPTRTVAAAKGKETLGCYM